MLQERKQLLTWLAVKRVSVAINMAAVIVLLAACTPQTVNPSLSVSHKQAKRTLAAMEKSPTRFPRPVVVLGGYHDPGIGPGVVCARLRRLAGGQGVIGVSYYFERSFDACRDDVIAAVERAWPSNDPRETVEVDVVGLSMGGVVGRYCAIECDGQKRLRIARLFTVSSPHMGAAGATKVPAFARLHRDLRQNSAFLRELEAAETRISRYQIIPYVRLGDWIVGAGNAAPRGRTAWWVSKPPFENAHIGAPLDPRIFGDIVLRLRGDTPFTRSPPATLPMRQSSDLAQRANGEIR
jgi:hypothetical protein